MQGQNCRRQVVSMRVSGLTPVPNPKNEDLLLESYAKLRIAKAVLD